MLVALAGTASPAAAEITGPCDGTAEWESGLTVTASAIRLGDVVDIPEKGTVKWTGTIALDPPPQEPRPVSGWVKVKLPFPVGQVTVADWSDDGVLTSNSGSYEYELPSILAGFDVTVTGKHWEGTHTFAGEPTCSGTVTLKLEGTNPAGFITAGFTVISLAGVFLAVRAKGPSAGGRTRR